MTTLPQAAPLRLPRPAPATPLAIPTGPISPMSGMVAQVQSGAQMSGADVWRVIRSNLWLIILLVVVGGVTGYGINYWLQKNHSKYTAVGTLQVVAPDVSETGAMVDTSSLSLDLKTHAALFKDPSLATQVLQNQDNDEIRHSTWFMQFQNGSLQLAKQDLADNLEVAIAPDSRLLKIAMTCNDPNSARVIVETFCEQYMKNQKEINENKEYDRHKDLETRQVREEMALKGVNGEIADLESQLNEGGITGTLNKVSTKDMELSELLQKSLQLELDLAAAQDLYKSTYDQISSDQDPPKVAEMIAADPEVSGYRQLVNNLELSVSESLENLDSQNPNVKDLQAREQLLEGKLNASEADARIRYRTEALEESREAVTQAKRALDSMNTRIESLRGDMAHLTDVMTTLLQKQSEKEGYELKLKQINDRMDQIANYAVKRDFSSIQWAAKPETPDAPSFPKLSVTLTLAIFTGLALALGIAFLRELLDTTIRSPRDINRVGNMNVLGMVPHEDDDPQSAGARLPVVIFEAPHSMMAEQLRQVRTRLQHSSSLDTTRSILVTSPSPGDGKSTIACNLASGLALNGRRILLVDANFRRPELHRVFNLSNEQGFSDVLGSLEMFETTMHETQVPNLFVLPSGPKPTNATELLESQLLIDFIERALEEFDHVIFDSGPLLFVSETVALAPRVDGVVTVVRARANSRGVLSRMRENLRQVKAEHLGIVLNAVRAQGGGYYGRNIRTYYEYQSGTTPTGGGGGRAA
jgi:succinoglycan biosynthesis transport protein ExoP